MSIKVTPNSDGSFTVTCEGVDVVVGRNNDARPSPNAGDTDAPDSESDAGPIIWPNDPETNEGGVFAYLTARPRASTARFARRAEGRLPPPLLPLLSPSELSLFLDRAFQSERARRNRLHEQRCMRVMLGAIPEQVIDLDALIVELRPLAERAGLRIELHIAVAVGLGLLSGKS